MGLASGHLQVAHFLDKETRFRLPVKIWRGMMDSYYPNSAWLCLHKDVFDRLYQFKVRHGLATWEEVIESIVPAEEAVVADESHGRGPDRQGGAV